MDIQTMLDNAMEHSRAEAMKTSIQLTLGELILKLEAILAQHSDKYKVGESEYDRKVEFDFEYLHPTALSSWRGSYRELAIEFGVEGDAPTITKFLTDLKEAVGKTYEGYKGGDFVMGKATPIWVANWGNSGSTAVVDVELRDDDVILKTAYCKY